MADPLSLAITVALNVASMALTATRKIEGPRLTDLSATVADYGTPINYFRGIRRLETPCFFCEPIKEVKKKRKTKGGKYKDYTYFGTFALLVAANEIESVSRVWFDRHLVFDSTSVGPNSIFSLKDNYELAFYMRIYLGTETQTPDPRILATIEANEGVGMCPAYRGWAYILFEDIPLEKLGNRFPQGSVEAITASSPAYLYESFARPNPRPNQALTFSPDRSRMLVGSVQDYEVWDLATRTVMISGTWPSTVYLGDRFGISNDGTIWAMASTADAVITFQADGTQLSGGAFGAGFACAAGFQINVWIVEDGNSVEHAFTASDLVIETWYSFSADATGLLGGSAEHVPSTEVGSAFVMQNFFRDSYGDIWGIGRAFGASSTAYLQRVVDTGIRPGVASFAAITVAASVGTASCTGFHNGKGAHFLIYWNGTLYAIDDTTFAIKTSIAITAQNNSLIQSFANHYYASDSFWSFFTEYDVSVPVAVRTIDPLLWKNEDSNVLAFDSLNNAFISWPQFAAFVTWRYLDRITNNGVTVRDLFEIACADVGISSSDVEASAGTPIVDGYSWTQGPAEDRIAPILDLYDFDARPHNFQIQLVARGGASAGTITTPYFVREKAEDDRYLVSMVGDSDLPRRLFLTFADKDHDQQANTAMAQRPVESFDSASEISIDMTTWASDKDTAQQLVERMFRRRHFSREIIEMKLSYMHLAIEPADVWTLDLDGHQIIARKEREVIGQSGIIDTRWVRDVQGVAVLSGSTGATMDGRVDSVLLIPGLSKGFIFDVPLLTDSHYRSTPFLYQAAAPYSESVYWPGVDWAISETGADIDYLGGWDAVPSTDGTSWGFTGDVLGDAVAAVYDEANSIDVFMQVGTLTSATQTELFADETLNLALIGSDVNGWEIVQFATATLIATQTYTVSGFIRGARGTESLVSSHAAGDNFVPVTNDIKLHNLGASDIGDQDGYKAISQGRDITTGFPILVTFSAAANRPYSPANVVAQRDGTTGDWAFSWNRRTRIGGNLIDGRDVPLGETSESYKVEIMNGAVIVRTITSIIESAAYTSAQQVTDWGSNQASLNIVVRQVAPDLSLDGFPTALAA